MFKKIWDEFYGRAVGGYKSTIVGLAAGLAVLAIEVAVPQIEALPAGWAKVLAGVLAAIGLLLKPKAAPPAP